jgi:hypothetical protein
MHHHTATRLLAGLTLALAAVLPAHATSSPGEGQVAINYNRCDNNYDGWGLHVWKNPGIPLPGVEWSNPMKPKGKTTKEIWVNSGDRRTYTSLEDAKKAREEKPCQ